MANKKTLVLGASPNPARYSHMAIKRLTANQHQVVAIGKRKGNVDNIEIDTQQKPIEDIDTVTLYLNANNQKQYYNYILSLNPKRIIFNPGAENEELNDLATTKGIKTMEACTLVLLSTKQY
ncbi:MAG: CoA-binding protein [Chitinophagaceae bacterium]|nr:CoA-binding protein [Chitinophagaceae bacterium]